MDRNELISTLLPKNLKWAELGVFTGDFSHEIWTRTQPSKLYLVDIFPKKMDSGDKDGLNKRVLDLRNIPKQLRKSFNNKNVEIITAKTVDFLVSMHKNKESLDAVYIDASHKYDSVKADLEWSMKVVQPGGYILGHDYHDKRFPGVVRAVKEFCKEHKLKIEVLSTDALPTYMIVKSK